MSSFFPIKHLVILSISVGLGLGGKLAQIADHSKFLATRKHTLEHEAIAGPLSVVTAEVLGEHAPDEVGLSVTGGTSENDVGRGIAGEDVPNCLRQRCLDPNLLLGRVWTVALRTCSSYNESEAALGSVGAKELY